MPSTSSTWPATVTGLAERHDRRLPQILEILLVVLLAQALAGLLWKFFPEPDGANVLPERVEKRAEPVMTETGPNVNQIIAAKLFGEQIAEKSAPEPEIAAEDAPDTRLNLSLLGILAATEDHGSRALIGTPNGDEKPYSIGDDIVQGASLHSIYPDRILLSRAGALEALRLDKDAPSKATPNRSSHRTRASRNAATRGGTTTNVTPEAAKLVSRIRDQILADPSAATKFIRVQPASSGGRLQGYRLYPGRDRKAFSAVGLRPGDLVTQVNGIQLNDANTALQMLTQVSQANSVSVVIKRGGKEQTMNLNLN